MACQSERGQRLNCKAIDRFIWNFIVAAAFYNELYIGNVLVEISYLNLQTFFYTRIFISILVKMSSYIKYK